MKLKKNPKGGKAPVPYLTPSGPDMDFKVRYIYHLLVVYCAQYLLQEMMLYISHHLHFFHRYVEHNLLHQIYGN